MHPFVLRLISSKPGQSFDSYTFAAYSDTVVQCCFKDMSQLQRMCTGPRLLIGLIAIVGLLGYYNFGSDDSAQMASQSGPSPIEGLKLSIEQVAGESPTTIKATVTNTGSGPVTILTYDSPLDQAALQIGLLAITPAGASAPLDIAIAQLRRLWPPTVEQLVTLKPGESAENKVPFREAVVPLEDLGDKASVVLKGEWTAVWAKTKEEISKESLDDPRGSPDAFQGAFESAPIEVTIT